MFYNIIEVSDIGMSELMPFSGLTEAQLRNRLHPEDGLFIVESPKVIRVALERGFEPVSLLCERRHLEGDAADILEMLPEGTPVYTADREVLASLTGYTLTRGVLCAMRRPIPTDIAEILKDTRRVCVIQGVCDTTNIGSIFRSAAAMGIDAVVLSSDSCDPFNRRSVRVSMGSVFLVPWVMVDNPIGMLQEQGFEVAAMALRKESVALDDPRLPEIERLAIVMGTEGEGLPENLIDACDHVIKIPMAHGVDSLNVGAAAAVAFWALRQ